jgi:outer membrane lipoprotein-sorting protein
VKLAYLILALAALMARAESLDDVLTRMDKSAKVFRSFEANFRKTEYSALFDDKHTEEGSFKMKKLKADVVLLADFTGQDARKLHIRNNQLEIYHPKANSVEIYDTRKFTKSVALFLLVGFGNSKAELLDTYDIALGRTETIAGKNATRLDLTPKKAEAKKLFNMIQIWIPDGQGNPIQEKVLSGKDNKDYNLFEFSDSKIRSATDPPLPDADFELKLPPGVNKISPGR